MKTVILGDISAEGYDVVGQYESMPYAVQRLAERDIKVVLASNEFLSDYNEYELEILESTIRRYGARLEREEQ